MWIPVYVDEQKKLGVVSIAFFLESKNDAIIWRGPKKNGKDLDGFIKYKLIFNYFYILFSYFHTEFKEIFGIKANILKPKV